MSQNAPRPGRTLTSPDSDLDKLLLRTLATLPFVEQASLSGASEVLFREPAVLLQRRNLRVLSRDGFVTLGVGSDQREHVVHVTEEGRQAVACALPLWQKAQSWLPLQASEAHCLAFRCQSSVCLPFSHLVVSFPGPAPRAAAHGAAC